jgi:hypothetical protein
MELRVDYRAERMIAELAALNRAHPRWAVWIPSDEHAWIALRPASSRPPGPQQPMVWVNADTASGLGHLMQAADARIAGGVD